MKTRGWNRIMVAVRDFDRASQALLRKAAAIAQRFDAALQVVHVSAITHEAFNIPGLISRPESLEEIAAIQQQRLEKLVKPVRARGVAISCLSVLDYPPADGVVRQVLKHRPDLLIVQSQRHARAARVLLGNTDWELIRNCPCPLWLVKSGTLKPALSVLAAIDPFHAHAKPTALDNEILDQAGRVVGTGAGRLGVGHVYALPQQLIAAMGEVTAVPATPAEMRRHQAQVTEVVKRASRRYAIAAKDQLLRAGDPAVGIPLLSKQWKADLLVMGAVSRRGLKRLFIGHTAERVLDAVHCDVLVIKPRAFKCPVPRQRPRLNVLAGAQATVPGV